MSKYIAVVTCESMGEYNNNAESEDQILAQLLEQNQLDFKFEIWSDPSVDWDKYTHILIKSPWDYFDRYTEFQEWCIRIKGTGVPVFNDIDTVLWNSDKKYLQEIQAKGHRVIPTKFIPKAASLHLDSAFASFDSEYLIFKPSVSGGAKNTLKIKKGEAEHFDFQVNDLLKHEDFLLQPFINEVVEEGEYSFVFFGGRFSHAVLKQPKSGDFRVQHFFGGKITAIEPNSQVLSITQKIVDDFAADCLYARVDGVMIEGNFYLMELELIEPYLFLFTAPAAKDNYIKAIKEKLV